MKTQNTGKILQEIRKKYTQVIQMTETLQYDTTIDGCTRVLNQRARLLSDIANEHRFLEKNIPQWQHYCRIDSDCRSIKDEIRCLITTALALDDTIKNLLERRMNKTRNELNMLGKKSNMVLSYARN